LSRSARLRLVAPERRTIVVMKFIIELEIGLFFR